MIRVYRIACVNANKMAFIIFELFPAFTLLVFGQEFSKVKGD